MALGAALVVQRLRRSARGSCSAGFCVLLVHAVRLVRHGDRRIRRPAVQPARSTLSFRWSMSWFIFSEVMFFAAFFGALFYVRTHVGARAGQRSTGQLLWPDYVVARGRPVGPYIEARSSRRWARSGIPLINTIILLTSGVHADDRAPRAERRPPRRSSCSGCSSRSLLGFTFLGFQAYEYTHAYSELNLKLSTGVYGSTFFMLTGFHGFHVTIGAIMLIGDAGPRVPRATSRRAPLRLRGRGLVLALRRRRLAAAVHARLLAAGAERSSSRRSRAAVAHPAAADPAQLREDEERDQRHRQHRRGRPAR